MAEIQGGSAASASTTALTPAFPANPRIGNTLICQVVSNNSGVTSITGGGATWVVDVNAGTTNDIELWRGVVTGTPGTVITINTPAARIIARIHEWPGLLLLDQTSIGFGTGTTLDPGPVTPLYPFEVVFGHCVVFQTMFAGIGGGFSDFGNANSATFYMGSGYLEETAIAAADPSWTCTPAGGWDAVSASYRSVPYLPSFQAGEMSDQVAG